MYCQLVDYLLSNNLLCSNQSGFRPGYSTQDVLLRVTDFWRKAVEDRMYVGVVFLDLQKAFDCVNHSILLSKLPFFGFDDRTVFMV